MSLSRYFQGVEGLGVLATADSTGKVDAAVYSKPWFHDEQTVYFVMADRLSHSNLQANPKALYLFKEEGAGYSGKRLFLTKTREEDDEKRIAEVMKIDRPELYEKYKDLKKFLVYFRIEDVLPLIGDRE